MPRYTIDIVKLAPEDQEFFGKTAAKLSYLSNKGVGFPNGFIIGFSAFDSIFQELLPKIGDLTSANSSLDPFTLVNNIQRTFVPQVKLTSDFKNELSLELKKLKSPYLVKAITRNKNGLEKITFETIANGVFETQNSVINAWLSFISPNLLNQNIEEIEKISVSVIITHKNQPDISGSAFILGGEDSSIEIQALWGEFNPTQKTDILQLNAKTLEEKNYQITPQKNQLVYLDRKYKSIVVAQKFQNERKIGPDLALQIAKSLKKTHSEISSSIEVKFEISDNKIYFTDIDINIEKGNKADDYHVAIDLPVLGTLKPAFPGLVSGFGKFINHPKDLAKLKRGDIAILDSFKNGYLPTIKRASGIILRNSKDLSTEILPKLKSLGLTSAIGSIKNLTTEIITLNGGTGKVYRGAFSPKMANNLVVTEALETKPKAIKTATKILLHLKDPTFPVFKAEDVDGIGPIHSEPFFTRLGLHPNELTKKSKLNQVTSEISYYLISLSQQLPNKPIIYQISDFKTSELINLNGGEKHETPETNPILGKRGSLRHLENSQILEAEINLVKSIRNKSGIKNIWISLPFVRTLDELKEMKKIFSRLGLYRSPSFKLLITLVSPANLYSLEDFVKEGIDGCLVDYFDFANLLYGRDFSYQELSLLKDSSIESALEAIFKPALKAKLFTGIFNIPSENNQKLTKKIVALGVKSVSVGTIDLNQTRYNLAEAERSLVNKN